MYTGDIGEVRDMIAAATANLDRLQADIDHGRTAYADNADIQTYLDETQEQVNLSRVRLDWNKKLCDILERK